MYSRFQAIALPWNNTIPTEPTRRIRAKGTHMGTILHATYTRARDHALELAVSAAKAKGRCTLVVRSYDETVAVKKLLDAAGGALGVQVVTLKDWLQDAWELFGDGRQRFDAVQRELMVRRVLQDGSSAAQPGAEPLACTPGIVELLGTVARDALPAALAADRADFAGAELQVLDALHGYQALLEQQGLVEDSQVVAFLRQCGSVQGIPVVVLDVPTTAAQDDLLASVGAQVLEVCLDQEVWEADRETPPQGQRWQQVHAAVDRDPELQHLARALFRPDFQNPVQPQGAVRFAYAAGPYAHDQLAAEQLLEAVEAVEAARADRAACAQEAASAAPAEPEPATPAAPEVAPVQVLYVARDPRQRFLDLADRLSDLGISSQVRAFVPLRRTDFGRAWITLVDFVSTEGTPGTFSPSQISDFALSPFSFMSLGAAQRLDERVRSWRGQTVDEALTDLAGFQDEDHRDFAAAVAEGDLLEAVELQIRALVTRVDWPDSHRLLQVDAARAVREVLLRAQELGLSLDQVQEELRRVGVPCSGFVQGSAQGEGACVRAQVTFATLRQAACEEPGSVDVLAIDDLTAQDYPLKDDLTAIDQVMDRIGAYKPRCRIQQLRRNFQQVLGVPRSRVLLMRCLNDSDAKELRPAALLEELVDCYRRDPQNPGEVDKVMGLPAPLRPFGVTLGEDQLSQILDPQQPRAQEEGVLATALPIATVSLQEREAVLLPGRTAEELLDYPVLSPSAIEKYLQCPHKWYVESRLGAGTGLEAGFGPLESGTFAHRVLGMLHEQLKREGKSRVTRENAAYVQQLTKQLFQSELAREPFRYESAYVPLTQMEQHQAQELLRRLQAFVEWEADLLPDFAPQYSEFTLGEETPISYAGVHVRGRLDRLDLDPYGRAVVVDYKGGVGRGYSFDSKVEEESVAPQRVQALIYAQMVRRVLGVVPVGAVYVSYGKRLGIAGAYDPLVLDPVQDLQGIGGGACDPLPFEDALDQVEEELAAVLARMRAGDVEPRPLTKDACAYCPAVSCPNRIQA